MDGIRCAATAPALCPVRRVSIRWISCSFLSVEISKSGTFVSDHLATLIDPNAPDHPPFLLPPRSSAIAGVLAAVYGKSWRGVCWAVRCVSGRFPCWPIRNRWPSWTRSRPARWNCAWAWSRAILTDSGFYAEGSGTPISIGPDSHHSRKGKIVRRSTNVRKG